MEDSWLEHVLSLVKDELKEFTDSIEKLSDEMREDYLLSVKKAIVDFVLRDLRERDEDDACVVLPEHRMEFVIFWFYTLLLWFNVCGFIIGFLLFPNHGKGLITKREIQSCRS